MYHPHHHSIWGTWKIFILFWLQAGSTCRAGLENTLFSLTRVLGWVVLVLALQTDYRLEREGGYDIFQNDLLSRIVCNKLHQSWVTCPHLSVNTPQIQFSRLEKTLFLKQSGILEKALFLKQSGRLEEALFL